ncbi:MAG: ATP-binding protein [Alphaproteobacteria bacterium]
MFKRQIANLLLTEAKKFRAFALVGPRQSGKTTLLRELFPDYKYISLESPDTLELVTEDVRGFFANPTQNWIIDEAQNSGKLFSYLQEFIDDPKRTNKFILSGSQNFLLQKNISQSLAGRIGLYELLPLTYKEFKSDKKISAISLWDYLFQGQYPRPYHENLPTRKWFESYLKTYVERDVRLIENIKDLTKFRLFIKLCAGYHGQQLNVLQISVDTGVSQTTIHNWISILEASFLIFRLQPYYKNYNKRLVKTPKLYFYDSAIVCHLLGIDSAEHLQTHSAKGAIFEGFVISEFIKTLNNRGENRNFYYWKMYGGGEIDLLIDSHPLKIIEIKSGATFQKTFVEKLMDFQQLSDDDAEGFLIYAGDEAFSFKNIQITPWTDIA